MGKKENKIFDIELTEEEKKDEIRYKEIYDFTSSTMYRLVGIINHSGGTESGHYTSYIRKKYGDENSHKWKYANDRIVQDWDCKKITDECFGGPLPTKPNQYKMYSAYMLFYERVSSEEEQLINPDVSYYNLLTNTNNNLMDHEPPQKKQKLNQITREYLINTPPNKLPKYLSKTQESQILDSCKRDKIWNENKAAMIERQCMEKEYIETCIKTILLSFNSNSNDDKEELFEASKLALTLLFDTIGHCKDLNQIISKKERNQICAILNKSSLGSKWFLDKLINTKNCSWFKTLYDPKINHIYGETIGEVVCDLVITALKCCDERRE